MNNTLSGQQSENIGNIDFIGEVSVIDDNFSIKDDTDKTKILKFQCDSIGTGQTKTINMANADVSLADISINTSSINALNSNFSNMTSYASVQYGSTSSIVAGTQSGLNYLNLALTTSLLTAKYNGNFSASISGSNTYGILCSFTGFVKIDASAGIATSPAFPTFVQFAMGITTPSGNNQGCTIVSPSSNSLHTETLSVSLIIPVTYGNIIRWYARDVSSSGATIRVNSINVVVTRFLA